MLNANGLTGPAVSDVWVRKWWPLLALMFGVLFIVVGGLLFSS